MPLILTKAKVRSQNHSIKLVEIARHNAQWSQSYMTTERLQNYARRHGFEEGIAQQKAKDEKLLKVERNRVAQKMQKLQN